MAAHDQRETAIHWAGGLDDRTARQQLLDPLGPRDDFALRIMFPVEEPAGPKSLTARATSVADQPYVVNLSMLIDLGLRDVELNSKVVFETNPQTGQTDMIVTQLISNHSDKTMALYAFAHALGLPRHERPVPELKAGQVILQRFCFTSGLPSGEARSRRLKADR